MKLTRRERAAMELALAVLRHSALITTRTTDGGAEQLSQCAIREAGIALAVGFSGLARPIVDTEAGWGRLLRARLALYLRARLRAAAGDCGRWWAVDFPRPVGGLRVARFRDRVCAEDAAQVAGGAARRIAGPWWQQPDMPSHGGGR